MTKRAKSLVQQAKCPPRQKTMDEYFADWESSVFGFGYGSGERHVLTALRNFMELIPEGKAYDYEELEAALTPTVAWLLINTLGQNDVIEYGTSSRYAWLRPKGKRLRDYILSRSVDELVKATQWDDSYDVCYLDACNCGENGYEQGRVCQNPFFLDDLKTQT